MNWSVPVAGSVVDLGDKVAEGLVPYIIQAAYPSEGDSA